MRTGGLQSFRRHDLHGCGVFIPLARPVFAMSAGKDETRLGKSVIIALAIWWVTLTIRLYLVWLLNPISLVASAYRASAPRSHRASSIATLLSITSIIIFTAFWTPRYVWASTGNIIFWMTAQIAAINMAVATQRHTIAFIGANKW